MCDVDSQGEFHALVDPRLQYHALLLHATTLTPVDLPTVLPSLLPITSPSSALQIQVRAETGTPLESVRFELHASLASLIQDPRAGTEELLVGMAASDRNGCVSFAPLCDGPYRLEWIGHSSASEALPRLRVDGTTRVELVVTRSGRMLLGE